MAEAQKDLDANRTEGPLDDIEGGGDTSSTPSQEPRPEQGLKYLYVNIVVYVNFFLFI